MLTILQPYSCDTDKGSLSLPAYSADIMLFLAAHSHCDTSIIQIGTECFQQPFLYILTVINMKRKQLQVSGEESLTCVSQRVMADSHSDLISWVFNVCEIEQFCLFLQPCHTLDFIISLKMFVHGNNSLKMAVTWWRSGQGVGLLIWRSWVRFPVHALSGTQVNSAFHPSGVGKSSTSLHLLGLRWGVFACVGWQVTLCDPIWQVTPCSSEMDSR